jgi:histidinol-phosphate aminotransferase
MTNAPTPKPWIAGIHAYVPGKAAGDDGHVVAKLSANENPLGCSPLALEAIGKAQHPSRYPDGDSTALREAIGAFYGIDPALIIMGAGSGELLYLAASGYAGPGDEVLFSQYAFSLYDIVARRAGATPVEAPANDYANDVDAMLARINDKTRVVLVANPNNPTGTYLPRREIGRLHAGLPRDVLLVLDLAYAEYVAPEDDDGAMELAASQPNVLVTRTFSKAYGLAGERVGWGTGAAPVIDILNRLRGAFNVANTAQSGALAALADQDFVTQSRRHNAEVRASFAEAIAALGNHGLRMVPSEANFVLVVFDGALSGEAAYRALAEAGYMTRWFGSIPEAVRITIGTAEEMDAVAAILRRAAEAVK